MNLLESIFNKIILDHQQLKSRIEKFKQENKTIVFTNGCFDILHTGHVTYLAKAKELGDVFIVAVNSDASVRRLKGNHRPINKLEDRMFLLASLCFIDIVTFFEGNFFELSFIHFIIDGSILRINNTFGPINPYVFGTLFYIIICFFLWI